MIQDKFRPHLIVDHADDLSSSGRLKVENETSKLTIGFGIAVLLLHTHIGIASPTVYTVGSPKTSMEEDVNITCNKGQEVLRHTVSCNHILNFIRTPQRNEQSELYRMSNCSTKLSDLLGLIAVAL